MVRGVPAICSEDPLMMEPPELALEPALRPVNYCCYLHDCFPCILLYLIDSFASVLLYSNGNLNQAGIFALTMNVFTRSLKQVGQIVSLVLLSRVLVDVAQTHRPLEVIIL